LAIAAAVCLVLALVQVAHVHSVESDADHCPLCILMHTAAPVAVAAAVIVMVRLETTAPVFEPRTIVRYWSPQFVTRPPPTGC
jgi:hypothetical protein